MHCDGRLEDRWLENGVFVGDKGSPFFKKKIRIQIGIARLEEGGFKA